MCLKCILVGFTPSIVLLLLPYSLRIISTGFILLFSYVYTKYIHHITLIPPFFVPIDTHLWKRFGFSS
jgi:hypothetical protein